MQISEKCVELLHNFNIPDLRSNVLIANLETVQYGILDEEREPNLAYKDYFRMPLSQDILDLIEEWKDKPFSEDLFLILNEDLKQIVKNDTTKYSAQMFFPFYINKQFAGLAIFFKTNGDYVLSSAKAPKKIRDFIQKYMSDEDDY